MILSGITAVAGMTIGKLYDIKKNRKTDQVLAHMWTGRFVYLLNYFVTGTGLALYNSDVSHVNVGLWILYFLYGALVIMAYIYWTVLNTIQTNARKSNKEGEVKEEDAPMNEMS
jgi:hypothetical protein